MNDFEGCLVRTNIIQSKDRVYLLTPFMVICWQSWYLQSVPYSFDCLLSVDVSTVKRKVILIVFFSITLMENCIEFVSSHIVLNTHLVDDIGYLEWSRNQNYTLLLTILGEMWANRTMIHKHKRWSKYLLPKDSVHFLDLIWFELPSSIC